MSGKRVVYILVLILFFGAYAFFEYGDFLESNDSKIESFQVNNIPEYSGKDVIELNNNEPDFDIKRDLSKSFEHYGELDNLGRCTQAISNIGYDLMPTEPRGRISDIKPTGFRLIKYSIIKDGLYLYNRCHLIAYQLTAENDNEKNLITCTRHMNAELMQPYEIEVGNYIRKTHNHVLYRVTPVFDGTNPLVKGVQMEALSIEDNGKGIKFNVFVYNVQPGIEIDYKTGDSKLIE